MLPGRQAKDINADDVALGSDAAAIRRSFVEKLFFEVAKFPGVATRNDHYLALARAVRDRSSTGGSARRALSSRSSTGRSSTSPPST